MTLEYVRTVLAIVEHETFVAAATHLAKSQPVVSKVVAAVEHDLGGRLLRRQRGRARTVLTPLGKAFVAEMKPLLLEWQGAERRLRAMASDPHIGVVRLGAYPAVLHLLPPIVKKFRDKYSNVAITLSAQTLQQTLDALKSGDIDLAIRPKPSKISPTHVRLTRLPPVPRVVIAAKDHHLAKVVSVSVSDLARESWILPGKGVQVRRFIEEHVYEPRVTLECLDVTLTKRLVAAGLGISVVPELCLEDHERVNLLTVHVPQFSHENYAILTSRRGPHSKASLEFMALLKEEWERGVSTVFKR